MPILRNLDKLATLSVLWISMSRIAINISDTVWNARYGIHEREFSEYLVYQ